MWLAAVTRRARCFHLAEPNRRFSFLRLTALSIALRPLWHRRNHEAMDVASKGFVGPMRVIPQFGIDGCVQAAASPEAERALRLAAWLADRGKGVDVLPRCDRLAGCVATVLGVEPLRSRLQALRVSWAWLTVSCLTLIPSTQMPTYLGGLTAGASVVHDPALEGTVRPRPCGSDGLRRGRRRFDMWWIPRSLATPG
jgi:hypothetical protein